MLLRFLLLSSLVAPACSKKQEKSPEPADTEPAVDPETAGTRELAPEGTAPVTREWVALLAKVDTIVYRFHDASVPPEHHRSVTITVSATKVDKKVDSYGDLISGSGNPIERAQFELLRDRLLELGALASEKTTSVEGCTGGTANSLVLLSGEEELFKRHLDSCGSSPETALHTLIKEIGTAADALVESGADEPGGPEPSGDEPG